MIKAVKDLSKEKELFVEVINPLVRGYETGWTTRPDITLSKNIILTRIEKYSQTETLLNYYDSIKNAVDAIIVPSNFLVKIIEKKKLKDLRKQYKEYLLNNMNRFLYYGKNMGSDPEIFAEDQDGNIIPAFNFLGSKKEPTKGPKRAYGHNNIYWDGFQAEFDTTPSICLSWQIDSIQQGLEGAYKALKAYNPKAKLSTKTVFEIPMELLHKSNPEHVAFGCNPSLNIYGMEGIKKDGREVLYRSAGGHIHLSTDKQSKDELKRTIMALDAVLGVAAVSLFGKYDNPQRRQMYGLAGEYRLTPYGIEYRTLSNAWLFHPIMAHLVFELARNSAMFGEKDWLKYWKGSSKETIQVINNCDIEGARAILNRNKELFLQILSVKLPDKLMLEYYFNIIINGMDSLIKDPSDFEKNWNLTTKWKTHSDGADKNLSVHFYGPKKGKKI